MLQIIHQLKRTRGFLLLHAREALFAGNQFCITHHNFGREETLQRQQSQKEQTF